MEILVAVVVIPLLAYAPMLLYGLILWWFDRYEKEPLGLLIVAFLWGAIPAALFSLIAQLIFDIPISAFASYGGVGADFLFAGLIAPITEEPFKGLALLLLLLFFRREIDSPLDGILYGGLVGFGFAATENLLYFLGELGSSGLGGLMEMAFLRAVLFGLNHALFTGCTGLGIALARTSPRWPVKVIAPLLGLAAGITLHSIHNTGATLSTGTCLPLLGSTISDWIGVLALVAILIWTSSREQNWIRRYLADEAQAGFISRPDYWIIQSYWRRVAQRTQALLSGDFARWQRLGRYYRLATELAFNKHRLDTHGREQDTLLRVEQLRREIYTLRQQL